MITDEIVKRLVAYILGERLKPGDKLPSERDLMQLFAVGRSTLREGIKILSALGIVEVSVGEGMFVGRGDMAVMSKPLSWALLMGEGSTREVIDARRLVEVECAGLAAEQATDDEIAAIGERLDLMRASLANTEIYTQSDLAFHVAIARAAHNRVLYQVLDTLRQVLRVWILEVIAGYEDKRELLDEHVFIEAAIRARDPIAARRAMATHLDNVGARLLAVLPGSSSEDPAQEPDRLLV